MAEVDCLEKYVAANFPRFGVNKRAQVVRLLYEIGKREGLGLRELSQTLPWVRVEAPESKFTQVKVYLLGRRFPSAYREAATFQPYLPQLNIKPQDAVKERPFTIAPKRVFVEEKASDSYLVKRIKEKFPRARIKRIPSLKEYACTHRFGLQDYNKRRDNFFIVWERHDFLKPCPCTASCISCVYHILNLGFGCPFECTYCYLQEYTNLPGIIIPANIEDFFAAFRHYRKNIRIGTGEFTDSLALDDLTEFAPQLVEFFRHYPQSVLELKTKSDNIGALTKTAPSRNVVIAWSLNPPSVIAKNELYCPTLERRLRAAERCVACGYDVAFHFDPLIYYRGWEKDYQETVDWLFDRLAPRHIRWISLGTLRFARRLKPIVENRFPASRILDAELLPGFDAKLRYSEKVRLLIYRRMLEWIRRRSPSVLVYLCMENKTIWQQLRPWLGRGRDSIKLRSRKTGNGKKNQKVAE